MHYFVNSICCYACLYSLVSNIECLSSQQSNLSQSLNLFCILNFDVFLPLRLLFLLWHRRKVIIRFLDVLRNSKHFGDVTWTKWASELESFIFLLSDLLLWDMGQFMDWPGSLKALLSAEE